MVKHWQHRMRWRGGLAWLMAGAILIAWSAPAAPARNTAARTAKPDPSEAYFRSDEVLRVKVEIDAKNLEALQRDNRKYARCTVREGTHVYEEVGVHLKGAAGSFRGLDDRPALTLNFDKFVDRQLFHGMDKLALNNSVQDPSFMTEILCGEMFLAAGVPTTRGGHARVWLNGRDLGLYVLKEGFDKTFLKRHFKNAKGNLYDGGFLKEITDAIERTSGEGPDDYSDLKALAKAAQEKDPAVRWQKMEELLDLKRFINFIALEIMMSHWDGYALKKNNYRIYHDPVANKLVFFPHGLDQMFWDAGFPILPGMEGLVARQLVALPEGRRRYLESVASLMTNVFRVEALTNRINQLQGRLRPVLAEIGPDALRNHEHAVNDIRGKIIRRCAYLEKQVAVLVARNTSFDASGWMKLSGWDRYEMGQATLDKVVQDGRQTLHIHAYGRTYCAWRTQVSLPAGRYRFEAMVRTAEVAALSDERGEGAGVRVSGNHPRRVNQAAGTTDWTRLEYEFISDGSTETMFICELRATKGDVWFDLDSLKVRKL